eukprot:158985-Rhodomonas_salina.1
MPSLKRYTSFLSGAHQAEPDPQTPDLTSQPDPEEWAKSRREELKGKEWTKRRRKSFADWLCSAKPGVDVFRTTMKVGWRWTARIPASSSATSLSLSDRGESPASNDRSVVPGECALPSSPSQPAHPPDSMLGGAVRIGDRDAAGRFGKLSMVWAAVLMGDLVKNGERVWTGVEAAGEFEYCPRYFSGLCSAVLARETGGCGFALWYESRSVCFDAAVSRAASDGGFVLA